MAGVGQHVWGLSKQVSASPESCVSAGDPEFPEGALSYNVRILSAQTLLASHRNSQLKLKVRLVLVGSVHSPSPCCDITSRPHTSFLCTFHVASGWAVAGLTSRAVLDPFPHSGHTAEAGGGPGRCGVRATAAGAVKTTKEREIEKKSFPVRMKSETEKLSEKIGVKEKPNVGFHERNTAQWVVK